MKSNRYVFQVSFTEKEYRQIMPLLLQMKQYTGMSRSKLVKSKLERKRTFTGQFQSAQDYVEWSLAEALKWMDRHPSKEIKGYVDL